MSNPVATTKAATFLTPEDLVERYKVPVRTIHRWRYTGTGPIAIKVGRHLRYRLSDVEAWELTLASASSGPVVTSRSAVALRKASVS